MAKKKDEEKLNVLPLVIKEYDLRIVGTSPLICHAWSEKAKKMMLNKTMKKATTGKEAKRPIMEYADTLYWLSKKPNLEDMTDEEILEAVDKGRFGFPTLAFKASAIAGAYRSKILENMVGARGAFHIDDEFTEIKGKPEILENNVKIGVSGAEIRYRAIFNEWETTLHIKYNEGAMSLDQIVNLFNVGGFACGVGDWRPEKDGRNGMYKVAV
ncbi:MAG: hypothetical protein IKN12_05630 [Selenomonadaceae bacterium]|nr:hypothetical protein [Selenomonadaceae bacterium]